MNLKRQDERRTAKVIRASHRAAPGWRTPQIPPRRRSESRHPLPKVVLVCRQDKEEVPLLALRVHSARPVNDLGLSATLSSPRIER